MARWLLPAGLVLLLAGWLAPAGWLALRGPGLAAERDAELELSGVTPLLPWGARASSARWRSADGSSAELTDLRIRLGLSGASFSARAGDGELSGWRAYGRGNGQLDLTRVPADALPAQWVPLRLRGQIDGELALAESGHSQIRVERGSLAIPPGIPLQFESLVLEVTREASGAVDVERVEVAGPLVQLELHGHVSDAGALDLVAEIRELREPLRTALSFIGLAGVNAPARIAIEGPATRPHFRRLPLAP